MGSGTLLEFYTSLQDSALFDAEPTCEDVPVDDGGLAQVYAACSLDVAREMTEYSDVADGDIGANACVGPDGQAAVLEGNGSFDVSVDVKVLISGELSPDDD